MINLCVICNGPVPRRSTDTDGKYRERKTCGSHGSPCYRAYLARTTANARRQSSERGAIVCEPASHDDLGWRKALLAQEDPAVLKRFGVAA